MSNQEKQIKAEAQGHNGIISYEIDVDDNKVEDLKILKHSETSGIFNQVIDKLKKAIIDEQSFDVDAISGATVMTEAILKSAKEAINKEGVKLTPIPKKEKSHEMNRLKADVVVIGGGEAGLVAGCRALSRGLSVILVEKNGYLGGATILNGSNVIGTGSKVSADIFGDNGDSPEKVAEDVARESKDTNYTELTDLMTKNIGPAIDFISEFADLEYQKAQTQTPEHSIERQIELPSASSYEFIQKVSKAFEEAGGKVLLGTTVTQMIKNSDDEVQGVVADQDGHPIRIISSSVVLASGGYGANREMRGAESTGIDYYGPMTSTGDSYSFNADLHLKTRDLGWYKVYPHGVEVEPGIAKLTTYASKLATDMGAIYVNSKGKRIVDESDVYTKFRDAILKQDDKISYLVMDERTWKDFYNLLILHDFTKKEIKSFFESDSNPIFAKGSLEEIADAASIDAKGLKQTVSEYEKYVDAGEDEQFHRDPEFLHKFEGNTYYVVEQRARFATTLGGYAADPTNMQLQNEDEQGIGNYFGAGEVVGGANGHDSMPSMMNTWGISSGLVAGDAATDNALLRQKFGTDKKIVAIVGTNASKSYNRRLLNAMSDKFETRVDLEILEIKDLPMFNEDLLDDVPKAVTQFAQKVTDADGVVIATPEYDHAITSSLKSMLEWLSCAYHPFISKPVMIVGTSLGIQGTVRAQTNLRQILDSPGVEALVLPGHEFMLPSAGNQFDENDHLTDPGSEAFLDTCFTAFLEYIETLNRKKANKKVANLSDYEVAI